jgi:hypothetical protein
VDPRAVLDVVVKSLPGIEPYSPDSPAHSLVAIPTELSWLSISEVSTENMLESWEVKI